MGFRFLLSAFWLTLLSGNLFAQASWKNPDYKPDNYRNILVIAKVKDPIIRRKLEEATVSKLKDKGISAIPEYSSIPEADSLSDDGFNRATDSLQVDGLLVFTLEAPGREFRTRPTFNLGIGIPFRLGIFGAVLGTNVPLAGGTRSYTMINGNAEFYNRASKSIQWSNPFGEIPDQGMEYLSEKIARITVRGMMKDRLFLR